MGTIFFKIDLSLQTPGNVISFSGLNNHIVAPYYIFYVNFYNSNLCDMSTSLQRIACEVYV